MMLSSLGGYLDARGDFNDAIVDRWLHKMTGGRENFVEIVSKGFLMPFGNAATLTTISRRNERHSPGACSRTIGATSGVAAYFAHPTRKAATAR